MKALYSYADWRNTVPWTDEEIIVGLEEGKATQPNDYMRDKWQWAADHLRRTGRLSRRILGMALPFVVRRCGLCTEPALYRWGNEGRCKRHRFDKPDAYRAYMQAKERAGLDKDKAISDDDRKQRLREAFHKFSGQQGRPRK